MWEYFTVVWRGRKRANECSVEGKRNVIIMKMLSLIISISTRGGRANVNKINKHKRIFFTSHKDLRCLGQKSENRSRHCRVNNENGNEEKMIQSRENTFPQFMPWRRENPTQVLFPFHQLEAIAIVRWENCEKKSFTRDLCVIVTKFSESIARARVSLPLSLLGARAGGPPTDNLSGMRCVLCVERWEKWEKIWFRGWSWTTYNNELNIYHSVYLRHKEINVSSKFKRKICDAEEENERSGALWLWVLLVFHVLVSCVPCYGATSHVSNSEATTVMGKRI